VKKSTHSISISPETPADNKGITVRPIIKEKEKQKRRWIRSTHGPFPVMNSTPARY
jgi:hypothetical protein